MYFSNSTNSSISNGWFSLLIVASQGREVIGMIPMKLPWHPNHWVPRFRFGRTNPYTCSLLDAWTLASKEPVYGLVRPSPHSTRHTWGLVYTKACGCYSVTMIYHSVVYQCFVGLGIYHVMSPFHCTKACIVGRSNVVMWGWLGIIVLFIRPIFTC